MEGAKIANITLTKQEANLGGVKFEKMIIGLISQLKAIPRPIPPQLQSTYSTSGTINRNVEPIVDAYWQWAGKKRKELIEIKKGFFWKDNARYLLTSREQCSTLANGVRLHDGTKYCSGQYWVCVPATSNEWKKKGNQKWKIYRFDERVVRTLYKNFDRLLWPPPHVVAEETGQPIPEKYRKAVKKVPVKQTPVKKAAVYKIQNPYKRK